MHDTTDTNHIYQNDILESVLISDVDVHASPNELKVAAICHLTAKGNRILQISCGHDPEPDFGNFNLFPKMFPSLFPYGIGTLEDPSQRKNISLCTHIKHLLQLTDDCFQTCHTFQFITFNILQRREVL